AVLLLLLAVAAVLVDAERQFGLPRNRPRCGCAPGTRGGPAPLRGDAEDLPASGPDLVGDRGGVRDGAVAAAAPLRAPVRRLLAGVRTGPVRRVRLGREQGVHGQAAPRVVGGSSAGRSARRRTMRMHA